MSRMIFGVALCFGLAVVAGCGSKPVPTLSGAPEPEPKPIEPTPGPLTPTPKVETPKVETPKVVWEMDRNKHVIPDAPASGTLAGAAFAPNVVLEGAELKFRAFKGESPEPERQLAITLPQPIEGGTFKVQPDELNSPTLPRIFAFFPPAAPGLPGGSLFPGSHASYALTLELGKRKDGKVTGRIYLSLQDELKSVLAGTFVADCVRPHTEKPGPDDAPYITGEVAVIGAPPGAQIRVAYAAILTTGVQLKELQLAIEDGPAEQARWTSDDEKPRTTTLVAGDGKARPFRYEYVKLQPGRYLISAAVAGGPAVWKWLDVPVGGTVTENLTLDVTKTGGLEIAAPPGATGKVFIAPVDELTRPALATPLFEGLSIQVVRANTDIVVGKAVVKNLGAGRYEVRLGDERRIVDIVPGKTAEVNMTPVKK